MTDEEFFHQKEDTDRKKNLSLTRRIAYISIGASVFIALSSIVFQYIIYTTERNVIIKNPNAFSDTVNVRMTDENWKKIDTIKSHTNAKNQAREKK